MSFLPAFLLNFSPFNTLPPNVLDELYPELLLKIYPKGSYVFRQGQPSLGYLLIILSGVAGIAAEENKGIPDIVGLRYAGDFFGETVVLTGKTYPVSVRAMEELTCYLLARDRFENLLQSHKEFADLFNPILTERLRTLYEEMVHEQPYEAYGLITEPFKIRVRDVMSEALITSPPDTPVNQIARILLQKRISSVVITSSNGKFLGLVSERALIAKVLALNANPEAVLAADIMENNIPSLPPEAFSYHALINMIKVRGKYVLVSQQGFPVGIVTIGDLAKARKGSTLTLVSQIEAAQNPGDLAGSAQSINKITVAMVNDMASANAICEVVSELGDLLTRRLLLLAEEDQIRNGHGRPPVDYCWLTLGSGGRKEQTLSSDQDNAILYADPEPGKEEEVEAYFAALAQYVVTGLEQCGFMKCPHGIIALNPFWRQSLSALKKTAYNWVFVPTSESFRQFTLFLDYRAVYGEEKLARELRDYAHRLFRLSPTILHHLAQDDLNTRVPLGLFKQILVEKHKEHKDELDVKRSALVHIVDCVRILALREDVHETSTLARLHKLVELKALSPDDAEYFEAAFQALMIFRIRGNLKKLSTGRAPDNYINPQSLSKRQQSVLRESLTAVDRLQTLTGTAFRVEF